MLQEDVYMDDILTSNNNLDQLKVITTNLEQKLANFICNLGSSLAKVKGSQEGDEMEPKTMILPNQCSEEENNALGLGYRRRMTW